jgi:hypothetical protein
MYRCVVEHYVPSKKRLHVSSYMVQVYRYSISYFYMWLSYQNYHEGHVLPWTSFDTAFHALETMSSPPEGTLLAMIGPSVVSSQTKSHRSLCAQAGVR